MQFPRGEKVEILVSGVPFLDSSKPCQCQPVWAAWAVSGCTAGFEQLNSRYQWSSLKMQEEKLAVLSRVQYPPATVELGWKACWWEQTSMDHTGSYDWTLFLIPGLTLKILWFEFLPPVLSQRLLLFCHQLPQSHQQRWRFITGPSAHQYNHSTDWFWKREGPDSCWFVLLRRCSDFSWVYNKQFASICDIFPYTES